MEDSDDEMNRSSWDADERELLEEAMQSRSRLKRTSRAMVEEEREVEVEPEREGYGRETVRTSGRTKCWKRTRKRSRMGRRHLAAAVKWR